MIETFKLTHHAYPCPYWSNATCIETDHLSPAPKRFFPLPLLGEHVARILQIRGDCGWNMLQGSTPSSSSSPSPSGRSYWDFTESSMAEDDFYTSDYIPSQGGTRTEGPILNGRRHPLCGGQYFEGCDLGPYAVTDIGDGSCQQHLNTEGCHYDGGESLWSSASSFRRFVLSDLSKPHVFQTSFVDDDRLCFPRGTNGVRSIA